MKFNRNALAAVLSVSLLAPAVLSAGNHEKHDQAPTTSSKEFGDHLARFESKSIDLRREIGQLKTYKYDNSKIQTVNERLNLIKEGVNDLGKHLTAMEAKRAQANMLQKHALDAARPHLAALASETNYIIELVNRREGWATAPEFRETAWAMYGHVDSLYRTLDAITDYEAARARLDGLSARPSGSVEE